MRALLFAFVVVVVAAGCTAVDDFSRFHFADDMAMTSPPPPPPPAADLSMPTHTPDLAGLPGFGDECSGSCAPPLTCYMQAGGKNTTGFCSRACDAANPNACATGTIGAGNEASCQTVEGGTVCLPTCGPLKACHTGLTCCANKKEVPTGGSGNCAPDTTDFCGH